MRLVKRLILTIRRKNTHGSYKYLLIKIPPLILLLVFFVCNYDLYFISDKSMEGFIAVGSTMKHTYNRGDTVLCDTRNGEQVRRIIGLPGDTITFENGILYINGTECDETGYYEGKTYSTKKYTAPENCYFVMSDNRMYEDSRFYGCINMEDIREHICAIF